MEEIDALLDGVYARATAIQQAEDPEKELRLLLVPVRSLFEQQLASARAESGGSISSSNTSVNSASFSVDPAAVRPRSYISGAAAKFQALVSRSPPSGAFTLRQSSSNSDVASTQPRPQTYLSGAATRLHALVTGTLHQGPLSASVMRGKQQQSEAAIRIQALVRGKTQRQTISRQHSLLVQGTKVLKKYVLKTDRFPNCHVLNSPDGDMAPNFRRLEGTPLYGSAQPSLKGIQMILTRVAADGFSKVVWINLREEAVIYVDGRPFTARRSAKLNENDLVPGITGHKIQVLESALKSSLQEELKAANNLFEYWNEVTLKENELVVTNVEPDHVLTLPELYESDAVTKCSSEIESVVYYRIPIERENAPEHADVEMIMKLMVTTQGSAAVAADTAFVFNCQMGKRHLPAPEEAENVVAGGNFAVIREVQKRLKCGREAKAWVDKAIDDCASICNIRAVINEYHDLSNAVAKPAKRSYYLHHAMSFLERYFYLIVFGAYMIEIHGSQPEHAPEGEQPNVAAPPSFSKWLQQHPTLFRLLDDLGGVRYKSEKVLSHCVLKMDHFFGIARIPFELTTNVPNYRRIANEPIFGSAQCLEQGIVDVVEHLRGEFDRAIWINLREEAVIYVSGRPFCVRHQDDLMVNVEYPGIEVDEITAIERQVKTELKAKVRKDKGLFMYWYEPREMVNDETMEHINPQVDIKTLTEVYEDAAQKTTFDLRYARIPVSDETAPEEKDLDDMVRLLLPAFMNELGLELPMDLSVASESTGSAEKKQKTAVICNCQMGRGRTTTALVCVYMLRVVLEDSSALSDPSMLQELLGTRVAGRRRQSAAITGEFVVIRKLLKTLDNGHECKLLVDYAIDQCEHMQNLRDCIAQCRDLAVDRDLPSAKRDFFMLRAVNYLERYFYLMCFASYLLEERVNLFQRSLFVAWMNERYGSALYELLDNLCFEEEIGAETHVASMRWRWRRKRKLVSRLESLLFEYSRCASEYWSASFRINRHVIGRRTAGPRACGAGHDGLPRALVRRRLPGGEGASPPPPPTSLRAKVANAGAQDDAEAVVGGAGRRAAGGIAALRRRKDRKKRDAGRPDAPPPAEAAAPAGNAEPNADLDDQQAEIEPRAMSKKELQKELKRREREELRQFDEQQREERQRRADAKEEAFLKKREEEAKVEEALEEQERQRQEEKERKEKEEFDQWKDMFTIEEQGSKLAEDSEESQTLLQQFVDYIKAHKVVLLEDLAAEFNLATQDAISRVESLQQSNRLTGIVDDRGKFIYITEEEMDKVAKFIQRRGRLGFAELSKECNKLIRLEGEAEQSTTGTLDWLNSEEEQPEGVVADLST